MIKIKVKYTDSSVKEEFMKSYKDIDKDSGVVAYDYGNNWIKVQFRGSGVYSYEAANIGQHHLERMKVLADAGDGLNSYINTNPEVKRGYS